MGPRLASVSSAFAGFFAHCCQAFPEVLVQELVAEPAASALDVGVLRGPSWLDSVPVDVALLGPVLYGFACELRNVVATNNIRTETEQQNTIP